MKQTHGAYVLAALAALAIMPTTLRAESPQTDCDAKRQLEAAQGQEQRQDFIIECGGIIDAEEAHDFVCGGSGGGTRVDSIVDFANTLAVLVLGAVLLTFAPKLFISLYRHVRHT